MTSVTKRRGGNYSYKEKDVSVRKKLNIYDTDEMGVALCVKTTVVQ